MELESTYDLAFIGEELSALHDFFEIFADILNERVIDAEVHRAASAICVRHQNLVNIDIDSIVDMLTGFFFRPLKTILPAKFNLGVSLWTAPQDDDPEFADLYFKMVPKPKIDDYIRRAAANPDPRVSVFGDRIHGYWMIVVRKEQRNPHEKKLLK